MDDEFKVSLTIQTGRYDAPYTVTLPVSYSVVRKAMEPQECSNEPFTLLFEAMSKRSGGDVMQMREKKFEMREDVAKMISSALVDALIKYFGKNDTINGYRKNR